MSPSDSTETVTWCDLDTRATTSAVFTANALTFSPGTLTLEVSETAPYRIAVPCFGPHRTRSRGRDSRPSVQSKCLGANPVGIDSVEWWRQAEPIRKLEAVRSE